MRAWPAALSVTKRRYQLDAALPPLHPLLLQPLPPLSETRCLLSMCVCVLLSLSCRLPRGTERVHDYPEGETAIESASRDNEPS